MPVYKGNLKHIDANNVLTLAGQRAVDDATPQLAEEVCQTVVRLAQPVSVFYQFFYDKDTHTFLCNDPFVIEGETVRNYLENTEVAIIMAVTLGKEVEDACDELFMQKNFTKGILMDSAISIATEQMVGQLCGYIDTLGAPEGYKILWRITPGHSDTPQKQEVTLVQALQAAQIGISVTPTNMLVPRKAVTAIVGMNHVGGEGGCSPSGCASCSHNCHE